MVGSVHEQIGLPALVDIADEVPNERDVVRLHRLAEHFHAGILGRPVPFFVVALDARRDEILPRVFTSACLRNDMVDGQ